MSWIKEEELKAIRARADIVDILSRYITLNKQGKNYTALCPFHDDHDPSLFVSTDKQIYKCFVCGAGGDVFTFVQHMEQISFPEAVAKVADLIGFPLSVALPSKTKKADPNEKYYDILQTYIEFMQYELNSEEGAIAYQYLKRRKVNEDILKRFEIGYAPSSAQSLRFLEAKRFAMDDLEDIGLVSDHYATFQDRFVIPIHDAHGHPVGFTARRLNDEDNVAKYINSSQNKIYEKGKLVFNYHRAGRFARKSKRVILVEGAMDVLAFEKADIHESIACLGTACTDFQCNLIKQLHVPVTVCYDGDRAGQNATYKFVKMAIKEHMDVMIVKNTTSKDPDEIFDKGGKEELEAFVNRTISPVDFLFDYLLFQYNLENYEDKKAYAQELFEAVNLTCSEFEKAAYLTRIKKDTGFDFTHVLPSVQPTISKHKSSVYFKPIVRPLDGRLHAEQDALNMILLSKDASNTFKSEIGFFKDERCQQLSLYCYDIYRQQDHIDLDSLLARINEEDIRMYLLNLWNDPHRLMTYDDTYFQDILQKIKECTVQEQIDQINQEIEKIADPIEKARLATSKIQLIKKRNVLQKKGG